MQRAQSAVGLSSLLNADSPAARGAHDTSGPIEGSMFQRHRLAHDMATVSIIRPNGPLPNGQQVEASTELPRPYKCPMCDKAFHRLEHQTRHIRTHTGEKPHACQFPGCSKKFSRSDELTRHSRIHNNPHSRRGNKAGIQHSAGYHAESLMPPPLGPKSIRSAPPSTLPSPNVSPPHSFTYSVPPGGHYSRGGSIGQSAPGMDITLLDRERETSMAPPPLHLAPRHHAHLPYYPPGAAAAHSAARLGNMTSLSAYHMSRSHSHDDHHGHGHGHDDHYSHSYRQPKRSRPNSPNSTAPSSPTFSHDSLSPTPDHTPLATPAHSPRLRPYSNNSYELPPFRQLSLQHTTPVLPPLEPQADSPYGNHNKAAPPPPSAASSAPRSKGMSLIDILSQSDTSQRKLPVPPAVPKVAVRDLLAPANGFASATSSRSSASNSPSMSL